MKLPNLVKIGSINYSLNANADLDDGVGRHSSSRSRMEYKTEGVSEQQQLSTVLHECLHAILFSSGVARALTLTNEQEEILVTCLEDPMMSFIKDNPTLIKTFMEKRKT